MKKVLFFLFLTSFFVGCNDFDDSDLWDSVNKLDQRVNTLETAVSQMNSDIGAMQTIVNALNNGRVVVSVDETDNGYSITFSDGSNILLKHGTDGTDGTDGTNGTDGADGADGVDGAHAPLVGIGEENGVYYWTMTIDGQTEWLTGASGEKIPVTGMSPVMGLDADEYWTVDYGNGPVQITGRNGDPVKASGGDSFFSNVEEDNNCVTFTLSDQTTIVVPKAGSISYVISASEHEYWKCGETRTFAIIQNGVTHISIAKPDGWRVSVTNENLTVTAPESANTYAERSGVISIVAIGNKATFIASMEVNARDYNYLIDFEDSRILDYLAGPTSYGDNLYSTYHDSDPNYGRYYGYDDDATGLFMMVNDDIWGMGMGYNFWNGGIAISRWNDMTTADYTNQCSVYFKDATNENGGYNGSQTFAVATGYFDGNPYGGDARPFISFEDNTTECTFDHFWVTNSTYAALAMKNGENVADPMGLGDWFKLIVEAFDKNGNPTGTTVEFYLADFRTADSPGILTEWAMVDLTPLGDKVNKVRFNMESSQSNIGGMTTPAYFCFDNLAIKK